MTRANYSGLVIAGLGFFLTRFTVTLVYEDPISFYLSGILPLVLGLGLAAFGVALFVADVEASLVRMTALWCVIGAGTMLVFTLLTLFGTAGGMPAITAIRSQTYLSNFLIGGSVGGTLTGLYAARTRRQRRELKQQAGRLEVLNRMLRHEVLNAVTVIQGYARLEDDENPDAAAIIEKHSTAITQTIEDVKYLTWNTQTSGTSLVSTDLAECIWASVETIRARYPDARISVDSIPENLTVRTNERLEQVFTHLLENAVVHATTDAPAIEITVASTTTSARVSVSDDGPGLPDTQQVLLETGEITEFDDPEAGYGLNVVRLLVESFGGAIETGVTAAGTTISVMLPRPEGRETAVKPSQGLAGVRPSVPHLTVILGAAVIAGIPYGILSEQLGGSVAAIGVFYGINDPVVGWITHEFHSAVFAFVFAGLVSFVPGRYRTNLLAYMVFGTAWALFLWVVAAGIIAPIWLLLLGIEISIPTFSSVLLASHLVWGISLGALTALGYRYVTPWMNRLGA